MSSDEVAGSVPEIQSLTDTAVQQRDVVGLAPLQKPRSHKIPGPEVMLRKIIRLIVQELPQVAEREQWLPLKHAIQFLLWAGHHVPGAAAMLIAAKGTARLQTAVRAAAVSSDPTAESVLQPGTALLLLCVRLSESAADLVVESQSIRLLLQLLTRPDVDPTTKRHTGDILQALAATKLVYRDVLHGAGVVDALMEALTDATVLADLQLLQKLLWVLSSLSDDDLVYKDDMREAGLPAVLVALFSVYQANQGAAELRPIAAQILRCLHLMAHGDIQMKTTCRQLGLIPLLLNQLHLDIHQMDEPPLPAAAAHILALNSLPGTPRSPGKDVNRSGVSGGGLGSPFTPGSPLRRSGSSSGSSSPRAVTASGSRRPSAFEPPIPEETEMEDVDLPDDAALGAKGASSSSSMYPGSVQYGGRSAGFAHSSEASALRALGCGPSAVSRIAAAVLLRQVLSPVMSHKTVEVLLHGMMLPALYMQLVGPRVSLAMEASATLLALLTDQPDNQAVAVKAGAVPLLVQLLSVRNVDLASTAADIITLLAAPGNTPSSSSGALGSHTAQAVAGLTELLKSCAAHAYAVGLNRRRSLSGAAQTHTAAAAAAGGILDRQVTGIDRDHSLSPVHEVAETADLAPSSNNTKDYPAVGLGLLGPGSTAAATAAEQVAGTLWSGDAQQSVAGSSVRHRNLDLRQSSLNRDTTPVILQPSHHSLSHSNGNITSRPSLTSRERISGILGSGQCLVCSHVPDESCGFCPLSSAVVALCTLLRPQQQALQQEVLCAGGVEVVVGLLAGEVVHVWDHHRLVAALAHLLSLVVQGNPAAQDQVRQSGGVDIVSEALQCLTSAADDQSLSGGLLPLAVGLLQLLTVLVSENSANKLCVREAGVFKGVAALLDMVMEASGSLLEPLSHALLHFLIISAQDSPGCQAEAVQLGITGKLMSLLRAPTNDQAIGYLIIQALALLANKHQPAALAEVTAGGLVSVVMSVLQQQAMAGVLVSEVCMNALPNLLSSNQTGKQQALGYGVLPLLVHLLRSSPSSVTVVSAARTLTVLADHDTELQGQIISAGGLQALLDKLDPANAAAAAATAAQAAAAAAAANAAAEAAAEAVEKAAADAGSSCNAVPAAHSEITALDDGVGQHQKQQLTLPSAAGSIFNAVGNRDSSITTANHQQPQQPSQLLTPEQTALLKSQQKLAQLQVRVACLAAVGALAHDNMFTKNTARQEGVMLLLGDLLQQGKSTLHRLVATAQQQQQVVPPDSVISLQHGPLRVRTPRSSHQQLQVLAAAAAMSPEQVLEHQIRATELQLLLTGVNVLKELCHGAHSNQQAAAAGGLIDQLTNLAALALGSSLEAAAAHGQLLAALADALAAVCEFCFPNKLMARESGAVDVLSRAVTMAAEAPDMCVLGTLRLFPAIASCCGAVAALAADCEDDQSSFTANPDFMPALFRLLSVQDPALATQAARALEYIAIRNDYVEDAEDRSEFEADTIMGLIRTLSHGAITVSGSGRTAAARVAAGAATGTPSAAVVKEAADLLARVVAASEPAVMSLPAAAAAGGGSSTAPSRTVSGLGTAPAHPSTPPATNAKQLQTAAPLNMQSRQVQSQQQQHQDVGQAEAASGTGPVDILSPRPSALLPTVMTDHTSGLAVLKTWSVQEDVIGLWQQLVARAAPAFQPIAAGLAAGPWKPFKQQMAWMLLLLAAKNAKNRAIISKVQRTTLTPLAMQLENAERFHQQAAAEQAAAEAAAATSRAVTRTSSADTAASGVAGAVSGSNSRRNSGGGVTSGRRPLSGTSSAPLDSSLLTTPGAAGSVAAATTAGSSAASGEEAGKSSDPVNNAPGQGSAPEDEELDMLQAEVAFLGLMSSSSSNGHKDLASGTEQQQQQQ